MKKIIILFLLTVLHFSNSFSQEIKQENFIKLDSTWGKEMFPFPIRFAKNINYTGIAEVRFPPKGWRNPEDIFFWTYTYAWSININEKIIAKTLATDL